MRCNFRTKRDSANLHNKLFFFTRLPLLSDFIFMFLEISISAPDGRRPGRAAKAHTLAVRIARNGPCLRRFGEHGRAKMWSQRSERMRAEQDPKAHGISRPSRGQVVRRWIYLVSWKIA